MVISEPEREIRIALAPDPRPILSADELQPKLPIVTPYRRFVMYNSIPGGYEYREAV